MNISHLEALSPTGRVIKQNIDALRPGPPVYSTCKVDIQRKDLLEDEDPSKMFELIYEEGLLLAGSDVISISPDTNILVFNTSVASPHTNLKVPYPDFYRVFREKAVNYGVETPHDVLIAGSNSTDTVLVPPSHAPLDMLVWIMKQEKKTGRILPIDLNDLTTLPTGNELIDQFRLGLPKDKLTEIFTAYIKRSNLAVDTLLELYNTVVRRYIPYLPTKQKKDLMQGIATGYYRGDITKGLLQFEYDGLGKGPPSNPSAHGRITTQLSMGTLHSLNIANPNKSFNDLVEGFQNEKEVFGDAITIVPVIPPPGDNITQGEVLSDLMERLTPSDILKVIDPYATIFHDAISPWLMAKLPLVFADMGVGIKIDDFRHHACDHERELRVSEGIEMVFSTAEYNKEEKDRVLVEALARLTTSVSQIMAPLWEDVKEYVTTKVYKSKEEKEAQLNEIKVRHGLTDEIVGQIRLLKPTEKQLLLVAAQDDLTDDQRVRVDKKIDSYSKRKLEIIKAKLTKKLTLMSGNAEIDDLIDMLYLEQYGQLFERFGLNTGSNIPGMPSHGITYHEDEKGDMHLTLGWLMCTKGLAELWLGALLKRLERKS